MELNSVEAGMELQRFADNFKLKEWSLSDTEQHDLKKDEEWRSLLKVEKPTFRFMQQSFQ